MYYFLAFVMVLPIGRSYDIPYQYVSKACSIQTQGDSYLSSDNPDKPKSTTLLIAEEISEEIEEDTEDKNDDFEDSDDHSPTLLSQYIQSRISAHLVACQCYQRNALNIIKPKYFVLFHSWKNYLHWLFL